MHYIAIIVAFFVGASLARHDLNHGQAGRGMLVCRWTGQGNERWRDDCLNHIDHAKDEKCRVCMRACLTYSAVTGTGVICERCLLDGCKARLCGKKYREPACGKPAIVGEQIEDLSGSSSGSASGSSSEASSGAPGVSAGEERRAHGAAGIPRW